MSYTAAKLVAIAQAEIGYKEKASNSNLDDTTANAGSANYTKYARDLAAAGYYNGNKNGYAWCFTAGTLILTDKGYKHIEDIEIGDKVLNAYGDRFNTITAVSCHDADVIDVRAYGAMPFSVTPDHPFLSQRRVDKWHRTNGFKDWGFNPIGELNKGDMLSVPKAPVLYENSLSYDELWTLGYYVGDGCTDKTCYVLCANDEKAKELEKHTNAVRGADYASRTCYQYNLHKKDCSDELIAALNDCGPGAANKRVPTRVLFGTNETKRAFLDGYLTADGCKIRHSFNTVSEQLATGIAKLLFDLGIGCSINIQHRPAQGKIWDTRYNAYRTFNQREIIYNCTISVTDDPQYQHYTFGDNYAFVPIREMSENTHEDTVYTLTTDGDHTYTANNLGVHNCDVFVDWCFYQLAGKNKTKAEALECQTGTLGAGCPYSEGYYKTAGRLDSTPKVGDQVFFQQNGECVHTGIVEKVTSSTITTIEGNSSNQVKRNSYSLTNSYIRSFGHPKYDEDDDTTETTTTDTSTTTSTSTSTSTSTTTNYISKFQTWLNTNYSTGLSVDGVYGTKTKKAAIKALQTWLNKTYSCGLSVDGIYGTKTKNAMKSHPIKSGAKHNGVYILQGMLYCKGYDPQGFDGSFGSNTLAAVKKFQTAKSITVDGEAGVNTFTKLFA